MKLCVTSAPKGNKKAAGDKKAAAAVGEWPDMIRFPAQIGSSAPRSRFPRTPPIRGKCCFPARPV